MKKGQIFEGTVDNIDFPNKGTVFTEEGPVVVKNCIPGQRVRFLINKKRGGRAEGRVLEVLEKSPLETCPSACSEFPACGGCMYQTMPYEEQLAMKSSQVKKLLENKLASLRSAGYEVGKLNFEKIIPSPRQWEYRNKMEFSFGDAVKGGPLTLGLHKKGSNYDILTTADCRIVHPDFTAVLRCVLEYFTQHDMPYYHKMQHAGYLRHLLIRRSESSGELLVHLVTTSQSDPDLTELKEKILSLNLEGSIAGIMHIINDSPADVVQSDETRILYGRDYFYETVLGLKFKVSTFSFFQTNTLGAGRLYETARYYIGDTSGMTVYDLYSGTGTIAQMVAPAARKVIGVEIVEEAVRAARVNAQLNGLTNCEFIAGDVLKVLDSITEQPDFIILDPPRDGINPKALRKIVSYGVRNIIYISCKPTSLARDLDILVPAGYIPVKARCVDMFPNTSQIECVALMSKMKN